MKNKVYNFLMVFTYILFLPITILEILTEFLEYIIFKITPLRDKLVNTIMNLIFKGEN